jgi:hypothetical protein
LERSVKNHVVLPSKNLQVAILVGSKGDRGEVLAKGTGRIVLPAE